MGFLRRYQYKTWGGALVGHTITMVLSLAYISFLTVAVEGTLLAIAATSFWWSLRAVKRPVLAGMLPSLLASSLLQLAYFVSGRDLFPLSGMIGLFLVNFGVICVVSGISSLIGAWVRKKMRKGSSDEDDGPPHSPFSSRVKMLALVTVFFYISMYIAVPLLAKVVASSRVESPDEFIQNYDPSTSYSIKGKMVDEPVKRRMPLDSPYFYVSSSELEQLEAYCKVQGCRLEDVASKLNGRRQDGSSVTLSAYVQELDNIYAPQPPARSWKDTLIIPQLIKTIQKELSKKKSVTGKAAKKDTRPWWQKGLGAVKGAYTGFQRFDHEFTKRLILDPLNNAWNFAKKNPLQAAAVAAIGVGVVVSSLVWAPAAMIVGGVAIVAAGISAYGLAQAYHHDGWNGVRNNVFSRETQKMWHAGDIGGTLGRGTAEIAGKALELLPLAGAPKAAATAFRLLPEVRVGVALVDDAGVLNSGAMKVVKGMVQTAGTKAESLKAVNPFIKALPEDSVALVALNDAGEAISEAGKVAGVNERALVQKKAGEIVESVVKDRKLNNTPITQDTFRELDIPRKQYTQVKIPNESFKIKADTSNFEQYGIQHMEYGEVNKAKKVVGIHTRPGPNSPAGIIPGSETPPDKFGVYEAKVELYGDAKSNNLGKSSMFPDSWTLEDRVNAVNEAFGNKAFIPDTKNYYIGKTKEGMKIGMYLNKNGKITSSFPIYQPEL